MKVILRPWQHEDAPVIAPLADNPGIEANLRDGFPTPYTVADAEAYIASVLGAGEERQLCRAIEVEGKAAGGIGVFRKDNIYRCSAEVGYWLGEPYWGKGIMSRALGLICAEAFARYPIIRLYAEPFAYNQGSRKVLEKTGFSLEGLLRKNAVKNGSYIDSCIYALLREEARE